MATSALQVESFFSMIEDAGKEHMERGRIKVMGIAKTSFLVAYWVASANFRLIDASERQQERAEDPDYRYIPRQPRRNRAVPFRPAQRHRPTRQTRRLILI